MENNQILALLRRKRGIVVLFGFLVAALSFLFLILKEKNFKVSSDYLIVQNQSSTQDFYSLSKSAEYAGKILNEGIYSELFVNEIAKTGKVNSEFLPFDKKEKLKQWSKMVQVSRNPDLGIISVEVFDNNQQTALAVSQAVTQVLTTESSLFCGDGQNISVKTLSGPIVEKNPSIGNILAVSIGGFLLGTMLATLWILIKEDRRKKEVFSGSLLSSNPNVQTGSSTASRMEMAGNFMSDEENENYPAGY